MDIMDNIELYGQLDDMDEKDIMDKKDILDKLKL